MRYILQFILTLWCTFVFSQSINDLNSRVKSGDLTFDECMSFVSTKRFSEAIPSLLKLKQRYESPERYNGRVYYGITIALYTYYLEIGDIAYARNLINEAGLICSQREASPNNDYTRSLLCCRGQLESTLNNYDEALNYFHIANYYFEEANDYGEQYLVLLNNMGLAYLGKGDLLSSRIYMDEMKDKFVQLYGSFENIKDEDQFIFLAYYGMMLQSIGHESDAEKYYLNVINHCNKRNPVSSEAYLLSANNISDIYLKNGRWEESIKILEELYVSNTLTSYVISRNLAIGYLFNNQYKESISALYDMNESSFSNIEQIFSSFTGLEREQYWDKTANALINVNNIIAHKTNDKRAISMAYNNMLLCKNLSLTAVKLIDEFVTKSSDIKLKEQYKKYQALKSVFAYKATNFDEKDSLRREINLTERIILSSTGYLGHWIKQESKRWEDVRNELREGEIAIEYCHIPKIDKIPITEFRYGVFVLGHNYDSPIFIALDDIKVINGVFHYDILDPLFINELYTTHNKELYNMLWKPLLPYLNGVHTIYYSPVGPLNNLNFDVLCGENGKMLNEQHRMIRVSSTANLKTKESKKYLSSVLYGNIRYDESVTDMVDASSYYNTFTGTEVNPELSLRSENDRGKWGPIPSTKKEIDNIGDLFKKKGIKTSILEGKDANEESFKNLNGKSPEILHLATHGFVLNTPQRAEGNIFIGSTNVYSQKESYMMWAGIMLAGGNNIWQGNFDLKNVEDGILTADEISRLDLSNSKLVVLSACETAKGMIDPVDGVYGLQRAFKMAGAQTIVMSLWKVQDDATSMLMTQFYTYLTSGIEKHQALWKAMMDVKEKYKDPYYWAGFVMLD